MPQTLPRDTGPGHFAIDPISLMINECMAISLAMRKMSRWLQSGVAAILGAGDIFGDDEHLASLGLGSLARGNGAGAAPSNPLHLSFLQLRAILADTVDINDVESLTLLQPFLLTIESSATLGHVTALALNAISKFLDYELISLRLKNVQNLLVQLTSSLTHCRFEAGEQQTDDPVLLKVLRVLETIVVGPLLALLPNAVVSEVIQTCLSLACNKRRSEVLRRAAEMAMVAMTVRIFSRLHELEPEAATSEDVHTNFAVLPADLIGLAVADDDVLELPLGQPFDPLQPRRMSTIEASPSSRRLSTRRLSALGAPRTAPDKVEPQFDIVCIKEFFAMLISMISPSNQYQHMESTRVFALSLINTAIEVAGDDFPHHPSLMVLVSDPVSKDVLQIITSTDSPALLLAGLRLFCTMAVVLSSHLKSQLELAFNLLFKSILPSKVDSTIKGNRTAVSNRIAASKELIVESISFLWTRNPQFFSQLFVEFDCDFERTDLATSFIHFLCQLALPESAVIATDNVPPICLEGVLSFISGINERARVTSSGTAQVPEHPFIVNREKKNAFIRCTDIFNNHPLKGINALVEEKFISNKDDVKELAAFFYQKSARLNKKILGEYLGKPSNVEVLRELMKLFDFTGLRVDEALRVILKAFRLPGESQQIERVVEMFAEAYATSLNEELERKSKEAEEAVTDDGDAKEEEELELVTPNKDATFILSYSIIMLNTDLHNPQVKKQMDLQAYRKNVKGTYNGGDFPEWYLAKIYDSIRDSEIIMPEEYHGTEKWFDDAWNNLISSQSKYAREHGISVSEFDVPTLRQFDKHLFVSIVNEVVETLIKVFREASDDNIITKLMSSIDKCANICITYNLHEQVDMLTESLSKLTTLADESYLNVTPDENIRPEIPITQIKIEKKEELITISDMAVHFGRDFKAQLATVVLFRLIKKPACKVSNSWKHVIKIVLTFFEHCLINPNLFGDFQKKLRLQPLAKVKPRFIINRVKPLRESGFMSSFTSMLKIYSDEPPEPTDQEVESTLSTIDCVRSVKVPVIFDTVAKADTSQMKLFVDLIADSLPEFSEDKKRFFESEVMFLFEIAVCFSLIVDDIEVFHRIVDKLVTYLESGHVTKKGYVRLSTYLFLLVRKSDGSRRTTIIKTIDHLLSLDKDVLTKQGASIIQPLLSLVDDDSELKDLVANEAYWSLLRVYGSTREFAEMILTFVELVVRNSPEEIVDENYLSILGVLDDISSLGAIGAQSEQAQSTDANAPADVKDDVIILVDVSKRSVTLTSELGHPHRKPSYPLLQALAHQCFNPCREVRNHAVKILLATVLSSTFDEQYTATGVYEYGLFPLLAELAKEDVFQSDIQGFPETHLQILNLISKTFLQHHAEFTDDDRKKIWLSIVDNFVALNQLNALFELKAVNEQSLEVMKNMILVLQNEFLTSENTEVWDATWTNLNQIYPDLKEEIQ